MGKQKRNTSWYIALGCACVLILAAAFALHRMGLGTDLWSADGLRDYIESFSPYSELVFFAIQLLSVIFAPIPSNITALAGGMAFGVWKSFLISAVSITLGSIIVFSIARALGQNRMSGFLAKAEHRKYLSHILAKRDELLFLTFLLPLFPDDVICILAGLTDIPFRRFVLLVLCTRHWGIFVATVLGHSADELPVWAIALLMIIGLLFAFFVLKYGERFKDFILEKVKRK